MDLMDELTSAPEGAVRGDAVVVRPSLRAAVERFLTVFSALFALAVPFLIIFAIRSATGTDPDVDPRPVQFFGAFAVLDVLMSFIIPAVLSLAPAVQIGFTRYVFDDEGIRERVQVLARTERRVRWDKVTALHHRRTLLDRALGIERLDVVAYGERGTTLHLVGLREAAHLRGIVARQMRREATIGHLVAND